ncbi:MAG: hypothetical protein HeimC3_40670 [Candidatus Heimdallarchaeota archaeon LC_3]|nr:MAG: hypothetical protein HeimC3_40670 [Candidatus Heimdallarchaeota archaeon LC_3]
MIESNYDIKGLSSKLILLLFIGTTIGVLINILSPFILYPIFVPHQTYTLNIVLDTYVIGFLIALGEYQFVPFISSLFLFTYFGHLKKSNP